MTCIEARKLLYDVQTSRAGEATSDERKSLLLLAKAHLHVCVACNDFFEHERELIRVLNDRLSHIAPPVPEGLLFNVLTIVHEERVRETTDQLATNPSLLDRVTQLFRRRR